MRIVNPNSWPQPKGYSNAVAARGELLFLSGMIGWDESGHLVSEDFVEQAHRAFLNIRTLLSDAGAAPENVVRMTWYIVDRDEYLSSLRKLGEAYRDVFGKHFPVMAVVQVSGLMESGAKLEIEVTAVIPDD